METNRGLAGVLPPAGQIFEKWHVLENFDNFLYFSVTFKQGASRGAASGGSDFWKMTPVRFVWQLPIFLLWLSSRVLAGVLPPAGQIFEKLHFLENLSIWANLLVPFKQGSSRGLRRVRFLKNDTCLICLTTSYNFLWLSSRGLAGVLLPAGHIF